MPRLFCQGLAFVAGVLGAALAGVVAPTAQASWSPARAAKYLDGRLQQWFEWTPAKAPEGPCVSCHTGMTYLLARPALRQRLGESAPTPWEQGLVARLRAQVGEKPESYLQGVETVFAAFFLSRADAGRPMSSETRKAFGQLWSLQRQDGPSAGSWPWLSVGLNPWEHDRSDYFGAALAALAVGQAGPEYAKEARVAPHVTALAAHLRAPLASVERSTSPAPRLPLHDRLGALWASSAVSGILPADLRRALMAEVLALQQPDGSWTAASLGPWTPHAVAPAQSGGHAFATGYVAYVLQRAGLQPYDPRVARALTWLAARQQATSGAWTAPSLNKTYTEGSMPSLFMQDAATAFAALALLEAGR